MLFSNLGIIISFIVEMKDNAKIKEYIEQYREIRKVKGLLVDINDTNTYHKFLKGKGKVLEIPNFQRILNDSDKQKIILVNDDFKIEDSFIPDKQHKGIIKETEVQLNCKNFTNQQIFNWFVKMKSPENFAQIPYPNSFQTVGHMAHYNLTPQQSEFKEVIGEITLLKCPNIKTVVNKTQKLHNVYRTPILQHMAGQQNYLVRVKQVGTIFELNFQKVYWCSRLQQQRDRLLQHMKAGELLADIFCGVGPLTVRAARKGLYVIANDLNPDCFTYLSQNCKLNKVEDHVKCWNMCAREAMKKIYKEHQIYQKEFQYPDHIYMNLPVDAIQFLDVLSNYGESMKTEKMPLVHVNCFVVADSDEKSQQLLSKRIDKVLPGFQKQDIEFMHHIKNVTVIMRMYCVSLRLRPKYQKKEEKEQDDNLLNYDTLKKKVKQIEYEQQKKQ